MSEINEELTNEIKALKQQLKLRWSVDELALANTELAFQSEKKDDLINGLVVIKKEKAKRADELALLIDTANAPIFGIDIKGLVNEWNQTSEKITGYKKEEVLGLNWLKLIPVNSQKDAKIVAENALKGIVTSNFECIIRAKNGQEVILLVNTSTRRDAAGEITGVLGVSQDITEIDKLRTASESITTELKRVIENAKQAGVIADAIQTAVNTAWLSIDFSPDGHILKANDNYVSYLGYSSSEDLVGKHHKIFCDSNYIKSSKYKSFWKNLADGKQQAGEFKRIKKDGSETWINANYTPVIDTEGKVFKIIKIASDISEMHKLRTESESIAKELRQFIETANAPIFGIDNNGLVNEWNQTSEKITGFSKEEVLGKDLVETYITEDYREAVKRVLDSALKGKETANFEFPLFTKNNQRVTILLSSSTRRSASGEITGVLGVGQDITEVKKTEQKEEERQKKSNQFSSGLVAMSNVSIKSHDNWESIITQELTSLYEFYKLDRMSIWLPDLKGFSMLTYEGEKPNPEGLDFLSFTDFPIYFENSKKSHLIISNEVENDPRLIELNEYFNITKTRSLLDASAMIGNKLIAIICFESCTPRNWTPEETYFIRSFSENITTLFLRFEDRNLRKKNELIAKELRQFIETANAPIFGIDNNGLVNEWNQTSEKITGFKKVDVLGKDLVQTYITEDFREAVKQVLDNALEGKETANFEFPLFTKEGERVMVLLNSSTRRNAAGEVTGVLGVGQDITELVGYRSDLELKVDQRTLKLNEALKKEKELNELKSRFVSTASHEFRTPLSAINFAAGSIKKYWSKMEPIMIEEKLDKIENQVLHMTELLDDVLLVGQAEADEIRNHPLTLNLGSFIDEIIEEVYHSSKKAQKIVLVDTESLKSTDIYIDEKLGRNIFTNLISNAVKFSPDADKVIVELSSEKDYTIISVTDFGLGIPESEIEKIFMPFTRGENVDSIQGTGLGLSIVKEALVAMGGKIIVNSTLGKGTTFMAKIPKKQI
jgi:PAS domain S-box-containing protein